MNKKAFTLIEIIISIVLLNILGIISIITVNINNKNNELNNISNKIIDAANVYVEIEKDENGNSYLEEVAKGAKGIKIPITTLADKGYIDKSTEKKLYTLNNITKKDGESFYIMFVNGGTNQSYCESNQIQAMSSWTIEGKTIYLCEDYNNKDENIITKNENNNVKVHLEKFAVSKEYYDSITDSNKDNYLTYKENGIFNYYNEETKKLFTYYRGAVNNNYLKLGSKDGEDLYWRIVWYSDDEKKMKLILDETIPIYITNKNGQEKKLSPEYNTMYKLKWEWAIAGGLSEYTFISNNVSDRRRPGTTNKFDVTYNIDNTDIYNNIETLIGNPISSTFYTEKNNEWFNSTNLNEFEYILHENNFCYNDCQNHDTYQYTSTNNFECLKGRNDGSNKCTFTTTNNYSNPVGYLTYGEAIRAGLIQHSETLEKNLTTSGNYLINNNENILTSDLKESYVGSSSCYYFNSYGLANANHYFQTSISDNKTYYILNNQSNILAEAYLENKLMTKFLGTVLKPVIVLDTTNIELSKSNGTKQDPYMIIKK